MLSPLFIVSSFHTNLYSPRSHVPAWECLLATPEVEGNGMHAKRNAERWNEE